MNTATLDPLAAAVPPEALVTDPQRIAVLRHDVYSQGPEPAAVLRPRTVEELSTGVAAATRAGMAIVPRGGGMSYTGGYLGPDRPFVLVDTGALDAIVSIDETDMLVTVEAGCTWDELRRALQPKGLRAAAWGSLSGINATVGGGMSQNGVFWGMRDGALASAATSFDVVLADGSIVSTGNPLMRQFGPDLTGLFAADTGALGIKARVTLRLVPDGPGFAYGSFAFDDHRQTFAAMSAIARAGLASESFGFDPFLQAQRMKRESLAKDAKSLLAMVKAQGSLVKGLKEGAKVALAGRSFLDDVPFSLHFIAERREERVAESDMTEIRRLVAEAGGREVENTIPKILRANPFPPVNSMVGPDGERWVPVHGLLPHSKLVETWEAIQALYSGRGDEMERLEVQAGAMFVGLSAQAGLIEPVFFWPDALNPLHRDAVEPDHLKKIKGFPADAASAALVGELRAAIVAIFRDRGAAHFQIARTYPLRESHDDAAWELLCAVKRHVDPQGLMNPGSLGLA